MSGLERLESSGSAAEMSLKGEAVSIILSYL